MAVNSYYVGEYSKRKVGGVSPIMHYAKVLYSDLRWIDVRAHFVLAPWSFSHN